MTKEFYIELAASANSLEHHGVKGQKWGERNGPPYPLDTASREKLEKQKTIYGLKGRIYGLSAKDNKN